LIKSLYLVPLLALLAAPPALAQQGRPTAPPTEGGAVQRPGVPLVIESGSGRVVQLPRPVASVFAADPRVAEARPASPTSLFIFGVAPGRTTIAALDAQGASIAQHEVTVRPNGFGAGEAQSVLSRILPGNRIRVETRGNGVALLGEVATAAEAEQAVAVARAHLSEGQVVDNRLSVLGQVQVNLRVRIAEVSREVTRQLGIDWQAIGNIGRFSAALATVNSTANVTSPASRLIARYAGNPDVNALIDLLAQDRLITVLAEPNLTAMSGETASFLAGGEFPIPVGLRDGTVTIQFKQYGVGLAFVPTVMSPERISLRVRPEVSELSETGAVRLTSGNSSIQIPALTVRRAETTVELGSGQSFAIAGLLTDNSTSLGRAIPGVGEVPVLGALFRSDRYLRNETELVIIITPYVVRPQSDPASVRAPTDRLLATTDADRTLLQRQVGRPGPVVPALAPRPPGEVGFSFFR
jgi:pilus assembly protein CpaC